MTTPTIQVLYGGGRMEQKTGRILSGTLCAVLVATMIASAISINSGTELQPGSPTGSSPSEVWVDDGFDSSTPGWGVDHFDVIQDGVDAVAEGGTVYVYNGTYYENVKVDKTINLKGEDRDDTVVDAGGSGTLLSVISVNADWVNITGFTVTGSSPYGSGIALSGWKCTVVDNSASNNGKAGISLLMARGTNITGNNAWDNGYSNSGHGIFLAGSDGNNITGNNAWRNRYYGIYLLSSDDNDINVNDFSNNRDGIHLSDSHDNDVTVNDVSSNNLAGIHLDGSDLNSITGNNAWNNWYGIYSRHSHYNDVTVNDVSNNRFGIWFDGSDGNSITGNDASSNFGPSIWFEGSDGNDITGNDASNSVYGIYLGGSDLNSIIGNNASNNWYYGIRLYDSDVNDVTGNDASNNGLATDHGYDIHLDGSDGNSITGNNVSNNEFGIYLEDSNVNVVTGNNVSNNEFGIYLEDSDVNDVTGNNVSNNEFGIYLTGSAYNNIRHNSIIGNIDQAHDYPNPNYWDDGYPSGGNYWSDYSGVDDFNGPDQDIPGSDGIGDTPYVIDADSRDSYPLMKPFNPNQPPIAVAGTSLDSGSLRLDGSKSHDPEGDTLTYTWFLVGITDPTFNDVRVGVAPLIDDLVAGEYEVTLRVDDGDKWGTDVMLLGISPEPGKVDPADALADLMDDAQAAGVTGGALQMLQNALDKWNQGDKIMSIKHLTNFIDIVAQDVSLSDEDKNELIGKAAIILASMELG
jgi:parallel beta-helix repeat protein